MIGRWTSLNLPPMLHRYSWYGPLMLNIFHPVVCSKLHLVPTGTPCMSAPLKGLLLFFQDRRLRLLRLQQWRLDTSPVPLVIFFRSVRFCLLVSIWELLSVYWTFLLFQFFFFCQMISTLTCQWSPLRWLYPVYSQIDWSHRLASSTSFILRRDPLTMASAIMPSFHDRRQHCS